MCLPFSSPPPLSSLSSLLVHTLSKDQLSRIIILRNTFRTKNMNLAFKYTSYKRSVLYLCCFLCFLFFFFFFFFVPYDYCSGYQTLQITCLVLHISPKNILTKLYIVFLPASPLLPSPLPAPPSLSPPDPLSLFSYTFEIGIPPGTLRLKAVHSFLRNIQCCCCHP